MNEAGRNRCIERYISDFSGGQGNPVNTLPLLGHKEQPKAFERFGAQLTPTIQVLDSDGGMRYQFEGFQPAYDFLAQLELGLAHSSFARRQWEQEESRYVDIVNSLADSDACWSFLLAGRFRIQGAQRSSCPSANG